MISGGGGVQGKLESEGLHPGSARPSGAHVYKKYRPTTTKETGSKNGILEPILYTNRYINTPDHSYAPVTLNHRYGIKFANNSQRERFEKISHLLLILRRQMNSCPTKAKLLSLAVNLFYSLQFSLILYHSLLKNIWQFPI
jgi:hypothetical protein